MKNTEDILYLLRILELISEELVVGE